MNDLQRDVVRKISGVAVGASDLLAPIIDDGTLPPLVRDALKDASNHFTEAALKLARALMGERMAETQGGKCGLPALSTPRDRRAPPARASDR